MSLDESVVAGDRGHPDAHNTLSAMYNRAGFVPSPGAGVDASATIQAQLTTYGRVWLGPGTFRLATALTLGSNKHVMGMGRGLTILAPDAGVDAFTISTAVAVVKYSTISDLTIDGGRYGISVSGANQLLAPEISRLELKNLTAGIYCTAAIYSTLFHQLAFTLSDYGIYIAVTDGNGWNNNTIAVCQFDNLNIHGIHLAGDYAANVEVRGSIFQACDQGGLYLVGPHTWTIAQNWFESNGDYMTGGPYPDVYIEGTVGNEAWDVVFTQNYIGPSGDNQDDPPVFLNIGDNVNRISLRAQTTVGKIFYLPNYTTLNEQQGRVEVVETDVYIPGHGVVLRSPDTTLYKTTVADGGAVSGTETS